MLDPIIASCLTLHIGLLIVGPYTSAYRVLKRAAFATGLALVCLSFATRPFDPPPAIRTVDAIIAVVGSQLTVAAALWSSHYSLRRAAALITLCYTPPPLTATVGLHGLYIIALAVYEETIWRREMQALLGGSPMMIVIASLLFFASHVVDSRKMRIPRFIDIFVFSVVLGFVYAWTVTLWPAVVAHAIRNLQLFGLRYSRDARYRAAMDISAARVLATIDRRSFLPARSESDA